MATLEPIDASTDQMEPIFAALQIPKDIQSQHPTDESAAGQSRMELLPGW
jgi:hypothetical protein